MRSLKLYTSHIQRIHYGKRSDFAMHILNFAQRLPWLAIGMTAIALLTATHRYSPLRYAHNHASRNAISNG